MYFYERGRVSMAYRNKVYVSMDADNDLRYYYLMKAWKQSDYTPFNFYDAHDGKDYMLTAKVYEALKSDVEYIRDKTIQYIKAKNMILEYLYSNDKIISVKIQEMCGFTKQQARIVLDKMRKEELLKLCRHGNKSYHVKN